MRFCLTLLCLMICFLSVSQEPTKNFYLKKSLKQNGFQYQFTVLDEDKRGVWHYNKTKFYFWYKAQKVLSTQGGASGELINGDFVAYHENKQLAQKGTFCKGLKDGKWMYWRTDGTLIMIEFWKKGDPCGTKEIFNENGESVETIKHSRFSSTRTISDSIIVTNRKGELKSIYLKDDKGKIIEKQEYRKGELIEEKKKEESSKKKEKVAKKESLFKRIFKNKNKSKEKAKEKKKEPKTETKPKRTN